MNALYDAPVDANGNPLFHHVEVKERVDKLSPRPVSIRYAVADDQFAVSVRDRFGRLEKRRSCATSKSASKARTRSIVRRMAPGSAHLIVNAATQYVVNVARHGHRSRLYF